MPYQDQIASVETIAEHIKEAIKQSLDALEDYHSSLKASPARQSALQQIYQLNRVFLFIELNGASQLSEDCCRILNKMPDCHEPDNEAQLEAVIYGLTMLGRYVEFICNKPLDLPQLLFPPINELRAAAGIPALPESCLFKVNHRKVRDKATLKEHLDDYEVVKTSRRIRQMFQMGLIEIIRKTNVTGGFGMIRRSLNRLENQCGCPNFSSLWWIALGTVEGFLEGGLIISPTRIKLFARLDLQIRELGQINHNLNYKVREEADKLAFELLYLVSLSDAKDEITVSLKEHFKLPSTELTERNITQEFLLLKGLSENDYDTLFATILEDVIKVQADLITEEFESKSKLFTHLYQQLKQLHSLFTVLEYKELEATLQESSERVLLCMNKSSSLSEIDRKYISECLSNIETFLMEKRYLGALDQTSLQRQKMSPESMKACTSARQNMKFIIGKLESYANTNHEPELLQTLPATFQRIIEDLQILNDQPYILLVSELIDVIESHFLKQPATLQALELVADIACSIEFYLETRENKHTPSPKILQFADENLARLKTYLNIK